MYRSRGLPQAPHAPHAIKEGGGKTAIAKEMIIKKVEMAARQPFDLGQGRVNGLRIEGFTPFKKGFLIAEVTDMGTAARDDNGVGDEVEVALDQIAADRREAG